MDAIWPELSAAIMPGVVAVVGTAVTIVLNGAARTARARWGIEIEARHREALHSAIMSGLSAALLRGAKRNDAIEAAIRYAGESVPDAIGKLAPAEGVLRSIAEAKLREITMKAVGAS